MDPRNSAGRTSAPSTGNRTPRPSPAHAANSQLATPLVPAENDDWTIGASDAPPWELDGMTDQPAALAPAQPAPWEADAEAAPWAEGEHSAPWAATATAAPWDMPVETPPAPWDAVPRAAAVATGELAVPWDTPAPVRLADNETADPYDAFAPLADDFALDRAPAPSWAGSVFGDAFAPAETHLTKSFTAQAVAVEAEPMRDAVDTMPADIEIADEPPTTDTLAADTVAASPEETPSEAPPANPLEWPPVPTDFPPKKPRQSGRSRRQPPPDPIEWPPIPDLVRPTHAEQAAEPSTQPASLWDAPAITPQAPDPAPPAAEPARLMAATQPTPVAVVTSAPPRAAAEEDLWALPSFGDEPFAEPAGAGADESGAVADEPGAVFARYATGVVEAPARAPRPSAPAVETVARNSTATTEPADDLWFLANEPQPANDRTDDDTEAEPSPMQTAVATVLVAAIVIGLVVVFLLLFTSFFG